MEHMITAGPARPSRPSEAGRPSRRERPAKPALTRDGIIDAAVAVLERDGFEKLTMRRLAHDLDTGPASLYVYVRSTTEIHALVIDRLLADLDLGWNGKGWQPRLRQLLIDYIGVLLRYPGLAKSAVATWPEGPHYLDLVELILRLLTTGGVPVRRAAWGVDILLQQATAMAAEWSTRRNSDQAQDIEDLSTVLRGASEQRHPFLWQLGTEAMTGGEDGSRGDWAIDALVTGISTTSRPGE